MRSGGGRTEADVHACQVHWHAYHSTTRIQFKLKHLRGEDQNTRTIRTICFLQRCCMRSLPGKGETGDAQAINIVNVRCGWRRVPKISRAERDHTVLVCSSRTLGSTAGCWCMRDSSSWGRSLSPPGRGSKRNTVILVGFKRLRKVRSTRRMRPERERVET